MLESFLTLSTITAQLAATASHKIHIYRSGPSSMAKLAHALLAKGKNVTVVAKNATELAELKGVLSLFSPEDSLAEQQPSHVQWNHSFISLPQHPAGAHGGKAGWAERMAALYALRMRRNVQGILLTLDNFLLKLPPVTIFDDHELLLTKNMEMAPELVLDQAIDWGYVRSPMVSAPGEIALRGDILDIFCPGYSKPLRLEFFGDILDDIRLFDPSSQRSLADLAEVNMLPVAPVIASKHLRQEAEKHWGAMVKEGRLEKQDLAGLMRLADGGGAGLFSGVYYQKSSCLEDWLPKDTVFFLPGERDIPLELAEAEQGWVSFLEDEHALKSIHQPRSLVLRPVAEVQDYFNAHSCAFFTALRIGVAMEGVNSISLPERSFRNFTEIFSEAAAKDRPWQHLVNTIKAWSRTEAEAALNKQKHDVSSLFGESEEPVGAQDVAAELLQLTGKGQLVLSFATERARKRFLTLAEQEGIAPKLRYSPAEYGVFALISPVRTGAAVGWDSTLVLGEDVIQPRVERSRKLPLAAFQGLDRYDTLKEGDFLVHRDYGVASFGGLHRMNLGGTENDYLLLFYAGQDKLYLPVDRLSLVQRFKGGEGLQPAPDKLGGSLWFTSKEKAKKAIEKIAEDLVQMYALRKVVKGFRYSPISEMYREFEASFGFEETPDQARAIEDVLTDMEKPEPMDRLVCGDVGFGKTEVALRAAFRAALEGRQVAVLCPTTILAEQHYQTFRSRLGAYPVNVGMLSRFVPKQKQKEVLEATAKGTIDILIGTHRLLSKDVVFPNIGLIVLDEEQRFGVRHKERLKEIRKNVDVLTLTATPIPRTLQLSLSGIRELSIIETPPAERKPVATALIDRDEATLRGLLERELARDGQVFWVYNRVQGLERAAEFVKKLVPSARVGMAHGQMNEAALESTMHKFWHGELDVLVCTAIIESGLDFPRANTLIVDQAQLFGLGQLYQLRGRVGRSDKQAFAVFVTPDPDKLPEIARQRMRIILDLDYLGAGFQVAMEDLRLRGAGNILGETQSGHLNRLGLDLFLEMLEEAVAKLKGEPLPNTAETELSIGIPAFIPDGYITDAKERLRYYKQLSSAADEATQRDIVFELRDRFGVLPAELKTFVAILQFKRALTDIHVAKADIYTDKVKLHFAQTTMVEPAKLIEFITMQEKNGIKAKLHPPCTLEFALVGENAEEKLYSAKTQLDFLVAQ